MADETGGVTLDRRDAQEIATVLARLSQLLEGERSPNDLVLTYDQVHWLGAPHTVPPQELAQHLRAYVARIEEQLPENVPSARPVDTPPRTR